MSGATSPAITAPAFLFPHTALCEGSTIALWNLPSGNGVPEDLLTLEETADGFRILSRLPGQR